ncbi:hypothetical protein VYU27_010742, partial [Nannochloropsis oceanica]
YAAQSGLTHIWTDYCQRVKDPILAMREEEGRMADVGVAQGVIKFMEGVILTGTPPSRASSSSSRPNDSFTIADLQGPFFDAQTQALFHITEMREEAEQLLSSSLLAWLEGGKEEFKPPQWSFLINTLSGR